MLMVMDDCGGTPPTNYRECRSLSPQKTRSDVGLRPSPLPWWPGATDTDGAAASGSSATVLALPAPQTATPQPSTLLAASSKGTPMPMRQVSTGSDLGRQVSKNFRRTTTSEDLQITIPIIKPSVWKELEPIMHRMPVTFDERGTKECMTVRKGRWNSFVEKQKAKILKDIKEIRDAMELRSDINALQEANGTVDELGETPSERREREQDIAQSAEGDIAELQQLYESMDDWKDLLHYSGKSISMCSTRKGNEMKIHVVAFSDREDGGGVDFMRLSYKKSVAVRDRAHEALRNAYGVRALMPFMRTTEEVQLEDRWVQLLQQPDVGKFAIALAFKQALANDGVHLQFCDGLKQD